MTTANPSAFTRRAGIFIDRFFWPLFALVLLIGLWLRWHHNLIMPLWKDEYLHINRMHNVMAGDLFIGLNLNKWLYVPVVAMFRPGGPEGPWLARAVTGLFGVFTTAACAGLAARFGGRSAALAAALIYACLPMATWHERQAIFDPMLTALTTAATVLTIDLARRPRPLLAGLLGLTLAIALLTKLLGLPFLALPLIAPLLLTQPAKWLNALMYSGGALLLAGAIIAGTYTAAAQAGYQTEERYQVDIEANTVFGELTPERLAILQRDAGTYIQVMDRYLLMIVPALAALSLVPAAFGQRRREILLLLIPAFAFALMPLLADKPASGGRLAPRYLMTTIPPMVALAVLSAQNLPRVFKLPPQWMNAVPLGAAALVIAVAAPFNLALISNPSRLRLEDGDRYVYMEAETTSDRYMQAAMHIVAAEWAAQPLNARRRALVLASGTPVPYMPYLGPRLGTTAVLWPEDLPYWLALDELTYVSQDNAGEEQDFASYGLILEELLDRSTPYDSLTLYRVEGAHGPLADAIYGRRVAEAGSMADDYQALAAAARPAEMYYVFPAAHAPAFNPADNAPVQPLTLGRWPLSAEVVQTRLSAESWPPDGQIGFLLVDEARSDPGRAILTTLLEDPRLYYAGESWQGLLHAVYFVPGPAQARFSQVGAVFEDAIHLEQAALLDERAAPGDALRIGLRWRTEAPVQDSFTIFAHLFDAEGSLVAQYDGLPSAGLLPTTAWPVAETVEDRFVLALPPDLRPGRYELRAGLYNASNGLRLRLTDGPGGGDYATLGTITIQADEDE